MKNESAARNHLSTRKRGSIDRAVPALAVSQATAAGGRGKVHHRAGDGSPAQSDAKLTLCLPESDAAVAREVPEAFHRHFAYRRDGAEKELRRIRRFEWSSLLIGFVFLGLMMLLVEIIKRYTPACNLSSVFQEGLTILAWVAL
jgi:hypothetical protein